MRYAIILVATASVLATQGQVLAKSGATTGGPPIAKQLSAGDLLGPCTNWAQKKNLSNRLTASERDRCVAAGGPDKVK